MGRTELGAAWSKCAEEGRDYLVQARRPLVERTDLGEPV
ncbi:hypothetical protein [Bradyrhizobium macuxiense]